MGIAINKCLVFKKIKCLVLFIASLVRSGFIVPSSEVVIVAVTLGILLNQVNCQIAADGE